MTSPSVPNPSVPSAPVASPIVPSSAAEAASAPIVQPAPAGDRVELIHEVKVGLKRWPARIVGTVERTERRRHGLHFRRSSDDRVFSDLIVLKNDDGSLSTVTIDEFTQLRRI